MIKIKTSSKIEIAVKIKTTMKSPTPITMIGLGSMPEARDGLLVKAV